ncbi:cysteine--tRNA ligase [bacterium]|nr:cysteine--tRNA ligase [bacterium]
MIKISNTLTRKKETFVPLINGHVSMYVCGPTVYDFFHIGNARTFITFDMVRKYLEFSGYKVTYVMNITDVDDKIIERANKEGISTKEVAEKYTEEFFRDVEALKIKKATFYPKATEHIEEMLELVQALEQKGIAYNSDGDVFFDISKDKNYGKLSGKKLENLQASERSEQGDKKNNFDFALWKSAKEGEPFWESPWGNGRPGWHLECSVMSSKYLGETFDIHGGGIDLTFPHHENEIAQSECSTGKPFVKYWMHAEFLNINDEKMSKSLGNFFTAREVLKKYPAEAIRMLFLQKHYKSPINYEVVFIEEAKNSVEKITNAYRRGLERAGVLKGGEFAYRNRIEDFKIGMDDDFNTAIGISIVFNSAKEINLLLEKDFLSEEDLDELNGELRFLEAADSILGILLPKSETGDKFNALMSVVLKLRSSLRDKKDWESSDLLRKELENIGIRINDTSQGTKWDLK